MGGKKKKGGKKSSQADDKKEEGQPEKRTESQTPSKKEEVLKKPQPPKQEPPPVRGQFEEGAVGGDLEFPVVGRSKKTQQRGKEGEMEVQSRFTGPPPGFPLRESQQIPGFTSPPGFSPTPQSQRDSGMRRPGRDSDYTSPPGFSPTPQSQRDSGIRRPGRDSDYTSPPGFSPTPQSQRDSGMRRPSRDSDYTSLQSRGRGRGRGRGAAGIPREQQRPYSPAQPTTFAPFPPSSQPATPAWGMKKEPSIYEPLQPSAPPTSGWGPRQEPTLTAPVTSSPYKPEPSKDIQQLPKDSGYKEPSKPSQQPAKKGQPSKKPSQGISPVKDVTEGMEKLALQVPVRGSDTGGKKGRLIRIETNHLALSFSRMKSPIIYMYDVAVEPDTPKRLFRAAVKELLKKKVPNCHPAYDGRKLMYSAVKFKDISESVDVFDGENEKPKTFKVSIKLTEHGGEIDLSELMDYMGRSRPIPQKAIQAVDIILRQAPSLRFVPVGRSHFSPPEGRIIDLGDGAELWYGFYQSAILGWKPFLNIDVAHKAFPKNQHVLQLICELTVDPRSARDGGQRGGYSDNRLNPDQIRHLRNLKLQSYSHENINKYLKGLKITYELPNSAGRKRTYKVNSLEEQNCSQLRFSDENGQSFTIEEYFRRMKNIQLEFPNLPCLHVGSLQRKNPIYLPVEFCTIEGGQVTNRKMTETQTSRMIKEAATSAPIRKQKIVDAIQKLKFNQDNTIKEFGLSVFETFETVKARVLNSPILDYFNGQTVKPAKGVWRCEKFLGPSELKVWSILNLDRYVRENDLRTFARNLMEDGNKMKMTISECSGFTTIAEPMRNRRMVKNFFEDQKKKNTELVIVIVCERPPGAYALVKQISELQVGILTQCIRSFTLQRKMNGATISNILLKVNSKIDGINHTINQNVRPNCLKRPVMLVGADVTHPSPDQKTIPSVAAVCASHDPGALYKYNVQCRIQPPRTEIIRDLEDIMVNHLTYFHQKNRGLKPEHIIFFRDGVSEGEFQKVLNMELQAIRRACKRMQDGYEPAITFLVVQKRHHTRFFPIDKQDMDGRNLNVPPGTVVDTEITHPTELDFYLVSHASIQGVSRPTKYRRLWDDKNMSEDDLEELTYYLCHMFSRCTRSVSYPAPTYYAHLAAFRARVHIEGCNVVSLEDLRRAQERCIIKEDIKKYNPMFFV